jgi:hypothetical protein
MSGGVVRMSDHRRVVSTVFVALVVALTGALVLLLGSTAQGLARPQGSTASKRKAVVPLADLIPSDATGWTNANFGWSVAVSGSTAVVGAPYATAVNGAYPGGTAYIFSKVGGVWTQEAELSPSDTTASDKFGSSVAISGTTVVVGAPGHSYSLGAAYIYVDVAGTWTQQAELAAVGDAGESNVKFGSSVATSGSTVMVGADGYGTGSVYTYTQSAGTWTPGAVLTPPDGAISDEFGWSMSLAHSTLVVGAVKHAANGAAYVFNDVAGTWTYETELLASDGATNDYFGDKVATDGTRIVVGAPDHVDEQGAAYVFTGSGATWTQTAELTASDGGPDDCFGWAVSLTGKTILVGAEQTNADSGAAYVFTQKGARKWTQRHELTTTVGGSTDMFGYSVSMSGNLAIIGADKSESGGGSAFLYKL